MDNYVEIFKQKKKLEDDSKKKYRSSSRERLAKIITTKIRTTMIGALETMEKTFGFLWNESPEMRELYEKARNEILDRGNNQIRNVVTELEQYDVEWLRYQYTLPVKPIGNVGGNNE